MNRQEAMQVLIKNGIEWPTTSTMGHTDSPVGWTWKSYNGVGLPYLESDTGALRIHRSGWESISKMSKSVEKAQPEALDVQIGGGHYKSYAIQPVEYCMKNNLNYCQSNIVKYVTRYKDKNGKEDLEKVKHYVDLLLQIEYGEEDGSK